MSASLPYTSAGLPQKPSPLDAGDDTEAYAQVLKEFREKVSHHTPLVDLGALSGVVDAIRHTNELDDRKMLLEHVLTFLSRLPPGPKATALDNATVELLYKDLPHPPSTYVGNQYSWRSADGSGNNLSDPDMGKADTPYARSVQMGTALPPQELPDPGLIFDTLLRREKFVPHPAGLSSMMFAFAALVIHTVFRTSHTNTEINETSSYIDLAPLYGTNQEAQDKVRTRNGRGTLRPDTFAEDRLLLLPPAVCVLLVVFNRNHNYIANKLFELKERREYVDPSSLSEGSKQLLDQEEELFQTARLINCTWFGSCVFSDYFSAILGLVRMGNSWSLNPFGEIRDANHSLFERGRGNVCSVEFNCLYRWHATTSQHDEKWVEQLTAMLFHGKPIDEVTTADMLEAIIEMKKKEPDCEHWTFGNMTRQNDGTFKDDQLAQIIFEATSHPAGAFKARGTPHIMRLHEIMGIQANRRWGCCSLNDFRSFLGLKRYNSFSEWNSDPDVARAAEKLYGHIDRLELYTGLQAEEAKPVMDGAGLCPSYTISRAILSDAIALTRGDRFFTANYTPHDMTAWGFADCQRDAGAPGYGSMLGRLFMRTLPEQFKADSSFTWFPLMTPEAMKIALESLGDDKKYDLTRPGVDAAGKRGEVSGYEDVAKVLGGDSFGGVVKGRADRIVHGKGFYIASDDSARAAKEQQAVISALIGSSPDSFKKLTKYFYDKTRELIKSQSWTTVGATKNNVDIVRDVLKYVPVYWAAELVGIKLKANASDDGVYTPQELFTILAETYEFLFLDFEHWKYIPLADKVKGHIDALLGHIKNTYCRSFLGSIFSKLFHGSGQSFQEDFASRLHELGYDNDTLANSVLALVVGASAELAQATVHVVNTFLSDGLAAHVAPLSGDRILNKQEQGVVEGLVLEALRLDPTFSGVIRSAKSQEAVGSQTFAPGEEVVANLASACTNADVFAKPQSINPNRTPRTRYLYGDGSSKALGEDLATAIIGEVLRATYSFPNIRRAPAQSGVLKRFKTDASKTSSWMYLDGEQKLSPWATSMVVQVGCLSFLRGIVAD
ncbi:linoleate diol synthase [Irpex rosettiformis]|uniref:Linoleate diol synthase n=1 Tax=Irpex rosettiformis TaxID=378272 RepID=A0ACB8UBN2_9APHY|nr:linoleate diol synthase [Irpex rosettiformis]